MFPNNPGNTPPTPPETPPGPPRQFHVREDLDTTPKDPGPAYNSTMPNPFVENSQPTAPPPSFTPEYPGQPAPPVAQNATIEQPAATTQPPAQTNPSDYLHAISTKPKGPKSNLFSGKMLIILIVLGAALLILGAYMVFGNKGGGVKTDAETLSARITNLQALIDYGQKNPTGSAATQKAIAETALTLTSRNSELSEALSKYNYDKPGKNIVASESDATLITELDSAKSSGQLDKTYAEALRKKITSTMELMNKIYLETKNPDVRNALEKSYADLTLLKERLPESTN